jgi:glycosyltransferase involved in cell wall biosynthesis
MRIFLLDTTTSGHHLSYLKLFARAFIDLQHHLTIISPATHQEIFEDNFNTDTSKVDIQTIEAKLPDFNGGGIFAFRKHIKHTWTCLKKVVDDTIRITNNTPDLVFFSTVDPYIGPYTSKYELDYFFPYPWCGLYMKPQNIIVKWKYSFFRKFFLNPNHLLLSSNCKALGIFIENCADELTKEIRKPVVIFPDIVDRSEPDLTATIVKDIIREAKGRKIISLLGSLEKRKGILILLNAAKKLPVNDFFFVFAGELSTSSFTVNELSQINTTSLLNGYFYLKRIPDEGVFNAIISISTTVFAAYIDFPFSSNLIGKAALFNKPVIVTSGSYMESVVNKYSLGKSVKEADDQDVHDTILSMTSNQYLNVFTAGNGCKEYAYDNSYIIFQKKLKDLLSLCIQT